MSPLTLGFHSSTLWARRPGAPRTPPEGRGLEGLGAGGATWPRWFRQGRRLAGTAPPFPRPVKGTWAAQCAQDPQQGLVRPASPVRAFPDDDSFSIALATAGQAEPRRQRARVRPSTARAALSQCGAGRSSQRCSRTALAHRPDRGVSAGTRAVVRTQRRIWEAWGTGILHLTAGV